MKVLGFEFEFGDVWLLLFEEGCELVLVVVVVCTVGLDCDTFWVLCWLLKVFFSSLSVVLFSLVTVVVVGVFILEFDDFALDVFSSWSDELLYTCLLLLVEELALIEEVEEVFSNALLREIFEELLLRFEIDDIRDCWLDDPGILWLSLFDLICPEFDE